MKIQPPDKNDFLLVRVYGDSLGMPRISAGVPFYRSYSELLRAALDELFPTQKVCVYNRSRGGFSILTFWDDYRQDSIYFGSLGGILVLQLGIVDCAPRPVPERVRRIIARLPLPLRDAVVRFLHHNRARLLRSGLSWRLVNPKRFAATYCDWLRAATQEFDRIYVLNIAPTIPKMEAHSPGLTASIELYNQIIADTVDQVGNQKIVLVDVHSGILKSPGGIASLITQDDGHHITSEGHRLYARMIAEKEAETLDKEVPSFLKLAI
jgi:acyl-CoA thioesterase I